jgi:hypothetical protein
MYCQHHVALVYTASETTRKGDGRSCEDPGFKPSLGLVLIERMSKLKESIALAH